MFSSTAYNSIAVVMAAMSACARATFARTWALRKLGTAMVTRIPMIATTMSSSMRVKARRIVILPTLFFFPRVYDS